jgi:hypothetical protein
MDDSLSPVSGPLNTVAADAVGSLPPPPPDPAEHQPENPDEHTRPSTIAADLRRIADVFDAFDFELAPVGVNITLQVHSTGSAVRPEMRRQTIHALSMLMSGRPPAFDEVIGHSTGGYMSLPSRTRAYAFGKVGPSAAQLEEIRVAELAAAVMRAAAFADVDPFISEPAAPAPAGDGFEPVTVGPDGCGCLIWQFGPDDFATIHGGGCRALATAGSVDRHAERFGRCRHCGLLIVVVGVHPGDKTPAWAHLVSRLYNCYESATTSFADPYEAPDAGPAGTVNDYAEDLTRPEVTRPVTAAYLPAAAPTGDEATRETAAVLRARHQPVRIVEFTELPDLAPVDGGEVENDAAVSRLIGAGR